MKNRVVLVQSEQNILKKPIALTQVLGSTQKDIFSNNKAKEMKSQAPKKQEILTKEGSSNKNIENFLSRSNRYSLESVQFLKDKTSLLQQKNNELNASKSKPYDYLAEVNRIYEIRTQFNKFEQENRNQFTQNLSNKSTTIPERFTFNQITNEPNANLLQSPSSQNISNPVTATSSHGRAMSTQVGCQDNDDIDEVQINQVPSVSSRMQNLKLNSKSVHQISKLDTSNNDQNELGANQKFEQSYQPFGQQNSIHSFNQKNLTHAASQNHFFKPTQMMKPSNGIEDINISSQKQAPLFFHGPQQPQGITISSRISLSKGENKLVQSTNNTSFTRPQFFHSNEQNLCSIGNSDNFTTNQRDSHQMTSGVLNTNGCLESIPLQSLQNLGYAVSLVNKGIEDIQKYQKQLNENIIQILDLSTNKISLFPYQIIRLTNLKVLKLENNLIKSLPIELFQYLKLESFSVENNLISNISPEIEQWKSCIQRLNLSKNHINNFNKHICQLTSLTSLNLSSNDFTEIPFEMTNLVNLKEFSIDWFKYCLPPRRTTVQGQEGNLIILEIFCLLRENKIQQQANFLQFTTKFSDPTLLKLSSQIKYKQPSMWKQSSNNFKAQNMTKQKQSNNHMSIKPFSKHFSGQESRQYILNMSSTHLGNSTLTSVNDSALQKESEGIQFLPQAQKKYGFRILHPEELHQVDSSQYGKKSNLDDPMHKNGDHSLKPTDRENSKTLYENDCNGISINESKSKDYKNIQKTITSSIPLVNFSSQTEISFDDEALKSHNDLSFIQENKANQNLQKNIHSHALVKSNSRQKFTKTDQGGQQASDLSTTQKILLMQKLSSQIDELPEELLDQNEQIVGTNNTFKKLQKDEKQVAIIDEISDNLGADNLIEDEGEIKIAMAYQQEAKIYTQYYQIDPKNGRNLLHLAILDEDISALRSLIYLNNDLIDQEDFDGHTPLSLSIIEEKYFSAKILIFSKVTKIGISCDFQISFFKANPNIGGGIFGSCLTIGVIKLQYYLIRDLIRFGADVNKVDNDGNSPLHILFKQFNKEPEECQKIAQMLLDNGADPNKENNDKWCPLHYAVKRGSVEGLQFALDYNKACYGNKSKKIFIINKAGGAEGATLLHLACEMNFSKLTQLLLWNQVDIFAKNSDDKVASQLCQRQTLIKKLILLQQKKIVETHFENGLENDRIEEFEDSYDENEQNQDHFFKESLSKSKKFKSGLHLFNNKNIVENQIHQTQTENDNEDEENESAENNLNLKTHQIEEESYNSMKNSNLDDSADSFPIDEEDNTKKQANFPSKKMQVHHDFTKNNMNLIHISSQPRMIKNDQYTINKIKIEEALRQQKELHESKASLEEIEDEDSKGDAPKWFYKEHSQIPYSPNNLQKIQGMNETICQLIKQNNQRHTLAPNLLKHKPKSIQALRSPKGFKSGTLMKSSFFQPEPEVILNQNCGQIDSNKNKIIGSSISLSKIPKQQTMEACNFFQNLKNYKQVIKSASNIHEYQLKIMNEDLSLSSRLNFLVQLKSIQFKLMQVLRLITRENIYQLFCRSGIIEDFLKLGDDNLNTLINTSRNFSQCISAIYTKLSESPNYDNNMIIQELLNLFGDSSYCLYQIIEIKLQGQVQKQSQNEENKNVIQINGLVENSDLPISIVKEMDDEKQIKKNIILFGEEFFYQQDMKIDYQKNILKDFLEMQQSIKIKKDLFTQKTLITDQDFEKMLPSEEEYQAESEELTHVLSNYSPIKKSKNPLSKVKSSFFK